jgi:hypothetical protein
MPISSFKCSEIGYSENHTLLEEAIKTFPDIYTFFVCFRINSVQGLSTKFHRVTWGNRLSENRSLLGGGGGYEILSMHSTFIT